MIDTQRIRERLDEATILNGAELLSWTRQLLDELDATRAELDRERLLFNDYRGRADTALGNLAESVGDMRADVESMIARSRANVSAMESHAEA